MSARSKARKRAIDVLYESDARGIAATRTLDERVALADPPINEFTVSLIEGVAGNSTRIDEILTEYAEGWSVERMPGVESAGFANFLPAKFGRPTIERWFLLVRNN